MALSYKLNVSNVSQASYDPSFESVLIPDLSKSDSEEWSLVDSLEPNAGVSMRSVSNPCLVCQDPSCIGLCLLVSGDSGRSEHRPSTSISHRSSTGSDELRDKV